MRRWTLGLVILSVVLLSAVMAQQFTFNLIENFENDNGALNSSKWWHFGDVRAEVMRNPSTEARDLVAESCGEYSLHLAGSAKNWYVGGVGTELGIDASKYSRIQIDIYGHNNFSGKLVIELYDDDNHNWTIETDSQNNYLPLYDDKWVAEVLIQGEGLTRVSIPFSAFRLANSGVGNGIWDPKQIDSSGGLLKLQLVAIADKSDSKVDFSVDNILLTY